jgi:hypothetical protein
MFTDFRHRRHHFGDLFQTTIESAWITTGGVLMFLVLLVFYVGLLVMRP